MMQGKSFEAPVGAIVEIENGLIEPFLSEEFGIYICFL